MIKAVIFDFDGLIIDTETAWYESYKEVLLAEHQFDLLMEDYSKVIGTSSRVLFEYLQSHIPEWEEEKTRVLTNKLYNEKLTSPLLRPGVSAYLEAAKQSGLKIGLASSSSYDWVVGYLEKLGVADYFETIVTQDDVENVKPDPELYLMAISNLNVQAEETVAFEDSLNGSQAAIAAGIHCVVVPNPVTSHLDFVNHRMRLSSMEEKELVEVLRELERK